MKYNILITYDTGDSFNRYDNQKHLIELGCSLETATENLNRIQEHYRYYMDMKGYGRFCAEESELEELEKNLPKERWYSPGNFSDAWEYGIILVDDEGKTAGVSTGTWIGYFESLVSAEVVPQNLPKFSV